MAVRIRLKKLGRRHRPFYRICAMDARTPRDGRVLEELGTYDPFVPETDARVVMDRERVNYWLGVGAKPTAKVGVLIKKYGTDGTHLEAQRLAFERLALPTPIPDPGEPASKPKKKETAAPAEQAAQPADAEQPQPAAEAPAPDDTPETQPAEDTA